MKSINIFLLPAIIITLTSCESVVTEKQNDIGFWSKNQVDTQKPVAVRLKKNNTDDIRALWGALIQNPAVGSMWTPAMGTTISDEEIEPLFSDKATTKIPATNSESAAGTFTEVTDKSHSDFIESPIFEL